ncbi:MAG: hypothetical protein HQ475_04115 [SAR202 cluster bacterium]|nr:hypothetical protein [SAR202 cluster bacterium]
MNTKIGTSFGLALLVAMAAIATMFALGMFSATPARAAVAIPVAPVVTPTTAGALAQYTFTVTGGGTATSALAVGETITITFDSKVGVPTSIATSAVKLKASAVGPAGAQGVANQLVSAGAVTVSGNAVTITVPDMDPGTSGNSIGDNGILATAGTTITFTQAAGLTNPVAASTFTVENTAVTGYDIDVVTTNDTTSATSTDYETTATAKFTPTTAARGATVTVTGVGFGASCADCKIRLNPQNTVAPTTGAGGTDFNGSGSTDASGVFSGTITVDSNTSTGGYVWITDLAGNSQVSTTTFVQKAGATPRSTSTSPGSTVTVDLVDYTATATFDATSVDVGATSVALASLTGITTVPTGGDSAALTPFKFVVPSTVGVGTHKVKIAEIGAGTKSATFNLDVSLRALTVTPNTASPGQSITVSGTGFDKTSGTIAIGALTARAGGTTTDASLNHATGATITIDATGAWSYATRMPTLEAFAVATSNAVVITATDSQGLVGKSTSAFSRTPRTITLSPTTASPGTSITVTVTGFTVDIGEVAAYNAEFTVSSSGVALTGTVAFPIGSDGSGTGTVTIPVSETAGTKTITVTDNANNLNTGTVATDATADRSTTANLTVPAGTVSVTPASASTGNAVTVSGTGFPPNTTGSTLTFGSSSGVPSGGFITDGTGAFSVVTEVPAATTGGSLSPGTKIVTATIGTITGNTTGFSVPSPSITITPAQAAVEEIVVVTGSGFNSLGTVTALTIGSASALPSPAPRAARNGDITATITVPLLNPGTYTVVMTNATGFSAAGTFKALAAKATPAASTDLTETVFADVIAADDNLVRVWRFSNANQSWDFYDPRPAFATANTLAKTGAGDIVWVNVNTEQTFQGQTLFPGWNLISLK